MRGGKALKIVLLLIVLALSSIQIYRIHSDYSGLVEDVHRNPSFFNAEHYAYPYPIHGDEWTHLAQGIYMLEEKSWGFVNPYHDRESFKFDFEWGYHLFLAVFFGITQLDPVLTYQYLPAIFFAVNSIFLFLLMKRLTSNYYISLLSVIFFLAVPSNINLLGNWFAVPLTFSLFMIFWFFTAVDRFAKEKRKRSLALAISLFSASIIVYPFAAVMISSILPFYMIFELKIHKTAFFRKRKWIILIISAAIIAAFLTAFFSIKEMREFMIFGESWTTFHYEYPLDYYGLLPIFFAVIGFIAVLIKKMNRLFIIWPLICIAGILAERFTGSSYFISYERTVYYYMVGLAPLAATGLFLALDYICSLLKKIKTKSARAVKFLSAALITAIILALLFFMFKDYQKLDPDLSLLYIMNHDDYDAIKFIEDKYGKDDVVMADPYVSISIYPISKKKIVAMYSSNLALGTITDYSNFLSQSCEDKRKNIWFQFIISRSEIDCDFLEEIFNNSNHVYHASGKD